MLLRFLFGDDIFISYSRRDGANYAAALANELSKPGRDFSCFLDQWGASAANELSKPVLGALRRSSLLVLVGTPGAATSKFVRQEVENFSQQSWLRAHRPILPININGALDRMEWEQLTGLHRTPETEEACAEGLPSEAVIRLILNSHSFTKRNRRVRWLYIGALVLLLASITTSALAWQQSRRAGKEAQNAITQGKLAEENRIRAEKAARESMDSEVDGYYRLRRMYYEDAPEGHKGIRLGHAVAASSCVPGLFEPLALANLYEGLVVRLIDGGVYDNQGTSSLIDQGCNILLVSDASGQMNTLDNPGNGLLAVLLRTNSAAMARVRVAQYRELAARRQSSILRGLMFIHLKKDLQVEAKDWIDCTDPQDSCDSDLPLTKYGISKKAQESLAAVRTDLDSFSAADARALMVSGYRMTGFEIERSKLELDRSSGADWRFMEFDEPIARADPPASMLKLLSVAASLAFKIWQLSRILRVSAI